MFTWKVKKDYAHLTLPFPIVQWALVKMYSVVQKSGKDYRRVQKSTEEYNIIQTRVIERYTAFRYL